MFSPAALFAASVFMSVLYLPRVNGAVRWGRSIRKTMPVMLLTVGCYAAGGIWLLTGALAASALGDFALSRKGERAFLIGMVAFSVAHLAYIAVMIHDGAGLQNARWAGIVVLAVIAASTEIWLRPHTGALKWPVRGYVLVIFAMGVAALCLPAGFGVAMGGALLFACSDLILSIETFVLPEGHRWKKRASLVVWVSYFGAQIALFWAL